MGGDLLIYVGGRDVMRATSRTIFHGLHSVIWKRKLWLVRAKSRVILNLWSSHMSTECNMATANRWSEEVYTAIPRWHSRPSRAWRLVIQRYLFLAHETKGYCGGHRPCHVLGIFDKRSIDGLVHITKSFIIELYASTGKGPILHRGTSPWWTLTKAMPLTKAHKHTVWRQSKPEIQAYIPHACTYVCVHNLLVLKSWRSTLMAGWSHIRILRKWCMVCSLA